MVANGVVANGVVAPTGANSASIMRSMPDRVIGCTVFERYQKRCVRNVVWSVVHWSTGEVDDSVAIAVSWAIRMADILLHQK